jgi:hypothetical protein
LLLAQSSGEDISEDDDAADVVPTYFDHARDVAASSLFEFDQQLAMRTRTSSRTFPVKLSDWTVDDCVASLTSAGLVSAARVFSADRIDGAVLSIMTEQEVENEICRGFRLVERKRVLVWLRHNR